MDLIAEIGNSLEYAGLWVYILFVQEFKIREGGVKPPFLLAESVSIELQGGVKPPFLLAESVSIELQGGVKPPFLLAESVSIELQGGVKPPFLLAESVSIELQGGVKPPFLLAGSVSIELHTWNAMEFQITFRRNLHHLKLSSIIAIPIVNVACNVHTLHHIMLPPPPPPPPLSILQISRHNIEQSARDRKLN